MAVEPFKVTCKLVDGRVNSTDGLFFLDSILYHAWFKKYAPEVLEDRAKWESKPKHFGLPLAKDDDNRYLASCGFYHQYAVNVEYWNKRTDITVSDNYKYIDKPSGKIETSKGFFKNYHNSCIIRTISDIEFYGVGTIEKVIDLLTYINFVGKKPSAGWGMVKKWIVQPIDYDLSTYSEKYGIMRPIILDDEDNSPKYNISKYTIMDCGIKPPYWKKRNARLCAIPEVVL